MHNISTHYTTIIHLINFQLFICFFRNVSIYRIDDWLRKRGLDCIKKSSDKFFQPQLEYITIFILKLCLHVRLSYRFICDQSQEELSELQLAMIQMFFSIFILK